MVMELIGDHGLSAFIDVDVAHRLLAWLVELGQRFQCRSAIALRLKRHTAWPHVFASDRGLRQRRLVRVKRPSGQILTTPNDEFLTEAGPFSPLRKGGSSLHWPKHYVAGGRNDAGGSMWKTLTGH